MTGDRHAWWHELPQQTRDRLDQAAQRSVIDDGQGLPRYPYWSPELCAELLAWSNLEADLATAHAAWLEQSRRRAERAGRQWDWHELQRQARLREVGE